jgi:hypothetical protein
MTISSRTPEGEDNCCPVCAKESTLEPSRPPGDAPCPHCGTLLWYSSPDVEQGRPPARDEERSGALSGRSRIGDRLRRAVRSVLGQA